MPDEPIRPGAGRPDAARLDERSAGLLLPERPGRGHKGTFGKLLVMAGSLDYAGAALLVCQAAGRVGTGLVTLAVPESLQPLFAAKVVEATTLALAEDDVEEVDPVPALARILDHEHDALVVGPGLRPSLASAALIRGILAARAEDDATPAVVDAEALRSLAAEDGWWEGVIRPCVLTPHVGEFGRLRAAGGIATDADGDLAGDDAARLEAARDAAHAWGQVVVLKGAHTVIAAPRRWQRSRTPRSPPAGPATSWPGRSAACWPRASPRTRPRAWACSSTGWPATPCGTGSGTPGFWPAIFPSRSPALAIAWRSTSRAGPGREGSGSGAQPNDRPGGADRGAPAGRRAPAAAAHRLAAG
jgi:hydroxyethylthiazole kinase-like uncharacterized protein yjeF